MTKVATGIDVGTHSAKLLRGEVKGTSFVVTEFLVAPNPGATLESGWQALAAAGAGKAAAARVGLTGREVNVRYVRVPRVPDWQLRKLMRFEAAEIGGQSDSEVASDFNVLPEIPEIEGEDVVVLCMAREALLERHLAGLTSLRGGLDAFTPNAIALYNAFLHYGVVMDDTVLIANIGRESTDVVLLRGADLLFARNLSGGSLQFDEAIAQRFQVGLERAERFKLEDGSIEPGKKFSDSNREKASRAMATPAGQILSLLQSAVLFAKNQVKLSSLRVDRVLLCGGGAALDGLPAYLANAMGVPVERFDPWVVVDTTKLDAEGARALEEHGLEAVVALGLATTGSDPESYSVEILPERVRKRRDFARGPAFLLLLAALALGYLGLYGWRKGNELTAVSERAEALARDVRRKQRTDQATSQLVEENRALAAHSDDLFELAGSGETLVRFLAAAEKRLPEDFWLQSLSSAWGRSPELGLSNADEAPVLRVQGRSREGTDAPEALFEEFVFGLRTSLPREAQVLDRWDHLNRGFELALTLHPEVEPEPGAGEPQGAGD